ncbi:type I restriction modification DNA specificity protein [Thiovulum sp. ES]|nr:type I restriction modification DNA specificity protein [Thiovulum sp. ES]
MDNVKVLSPKQKFSIKIILFITSAWKKTIPDKGYSRHWSFAKDVFFKLPTKNGEIDFEFMENFISKIESERIEKLENYLKVTGLKDYELTENEKQVLADFENDQVEFSEFKIGDLFEKLKTNKLSFKASDLPKEETDTHTIPCLTSSFQNQGLNYFVPKDNATILKNVISIPSNSDIYRAYFQSREFTVLSDAYAINWIYNDVSLSKNQYLFTVPCINKVTDLQIYSYKNKLGGWNIVKNKYLQLPTLNDQPDYEIMETLISAIQKTVIKDVVLFADKKIETTKKVVNS